MRGLFINTYMILLLLSPAIVEAQVINAGVGGNNSDNLIKRLEKDVLEQEPDIVILMVGTNDMLNSKKMISYQKYESNLKKLVLEIKNTSSELILMSPPPADSIYLFERHDKNLYKETPNEKLTAISYINSRIAVDNNLKFIDLNKVLVEMNLPKHNEDLFFKNEKNSGARDGVHFTDLGYHFIGELVFAFLKENEMLKGKLKIICFGDSITRGNRSKGETYPLVLSRRIEEYNGN